MDTYESIWGKKVSYTIPNRENEMHVASTGDRDGETSIAQERGCTYSCTYSTHTILIWETKIKYGAKGVDCCYPLFNLGSVPQVFAFLLQGARQ